MTNEERMKMLGLILEYAKAVGAENVEVPTLLLDWAVSELSRVADTKDTQP